jgi:hypothetical protein
VPAGKVSLFAPVRAVASADGCWTYRSCKVDTYHPEQLDGVGCRHRHQHQCTAADMQASRFFASHAWTGTHEGQDFGKTSFGILNSVRTGRVLDAAITASCWNVHYKTFWARVRTRVLPFSLRVWVASFYIAVK